MIRFLFSSILLIVMAFPSMADEVADIYQVEIIIFEQTEPKRFSAENWPKFAGELNTKKAINLSTLKKGVPDSVETLEILDALDDVGEEPLDQVIAESVTLVDHQALLLNDEAAKIKASKTKRFVLHTGWNQPVASHVKSTPILVQGGKDKEIKGLVTVKPNRNVYSVSVDFLYKPTGAAAEQNNSGVKEFRITRDVKVKRKEVFYIDHPLVGMIVVISPVVYQ